MAFDFPSSPTIGQQFTPVAGTTYVYNGYGWVVGGVLTAIAGVAAAPQGRLTLQSATPVMTTTQAGKTTILYTPYVGNMVSLFDGANFSMVAFSELSVPTTDTTQSPALIGASKCNDWYVWNRSGSLVLSHGPDWTSDTVRSAGTALVRVSGIWLNNAQIGNGTTTGPLAQRGTYVGTTRSNASSSLDMIFNPAGALGGTANVLGVYNAYNRVRTMARSIETTTSWTRASTTLAPMNAAATGSGLNNRVSWVDGLQTSFVDATCAVLAFQGGGGSDPVLALALDSTTTAMAEIGATCGGVAEAILQAKAFITPQLGFHFVQALDGLSTGTAAETFFGKVSGMRPGSTNDFNLAYTSIELEM